MTISQPSGTGVLRLLGTVGHGDLPVPPTDGAMTDSVTTPPPVEHQSGGRRPFEHGGGPEHRHLAERGRQHLHADRGGRRRRCRTAPTSPGAPARLVGIVQMSLRYMVSGSSVAPMANAVVGDVGDRSTSNCSYAASKSRMMSVRTFWAWP
jgi:hypothetical protein